MEDTEIKKGFFDSKASIIITALVLVFALAAFGYWCFTEETLTVKGVAAAACAVLVFALAVVLAVPGAVRFFTGETNERPRELGVRSDRRGVLNTALRIILAVLAARIIIVILAYVFALAFGMAEGSIFTTMRDIWTKTDTDAQHYFNIAENWYTTGYPDMYTIVFLPLFPLLIRGLNYAFADSFISAMVINTVCSCAAAVVIYRLALVDMGRRSAKHAVLFAVAFPAAIFYIAPMSEALFLLLSASALLALRKERFFFAAVFGALASFTRSLGVVMLVPFAAEAIAYAVRRHRENRKGLSWTVIRLTLCAVVLMSGTFAYLLINKLVWNDWFKFLEFQREVWYQEPYPFFGTVAKQVDELFLAFGHDPYGVFGLWIPNLLYIFGALAVFVSSARVLRTSYAMYFAAYIAVSCGASWLLSAPRYLTALVVLPIALAQLCAGRDDGVAIGRSRAKAAIVASVLIVGQVAYLLMYVLQYSIY